MKQKIFLYLKGVAMGAADVVPGVSGGTIAFISGIYEELLGSIKSVDLEALQLLLKFDFKGFWQKINGSFLLTLFLGIGTSIATLSKIIVYLLSNHPELLWSFFFGLIIASAILVGKTVKSYNAVTFVAFIIGVSVAYYITVASPAETPTSWWFIFLSGALAICAMILPGISGAFILLLLGKYEFILSAINFKNPKFDVIALFALGCVTGLLTFSRLLNFMLQKYHNFTIALLTGFMVGSLNKVWPWKQTLETFTDRHGIEKPFIQTNISPFDYQEITGETPYLWQAIVLAFVGFFVVYGVEKLGKSNEVIES